MILDEIRAQAGRMSAAKRAVAAFIVENWRYTAFLNASQIANEAGVSESVVVRFAKDLGFSGYPQLQERIRDLVMRDLGILDLYQGAAESRNSSIAHRIQHSVEADMANFTQSVEAIDPDQAEAAARLLLGAREIAVIGLRSSLGPASVLALYLNAALGNTRHYDNAHGDVYDQLRRLDKRDVAVVIGFRHYNRETLEQAGFVHQRGVPVIGITDSPQSPLVPLSQHTFYVHTESPSFYLSQIGTMAVVNVLLLLVATLGDTDAQSRSLYEMQAIYDQHYYSTGTPKHAPTDEGNAVG